MSGVGRSLSTSTTIWTTQANTMATTTGTAIGSGTGSRKERGNVESKSLSSPGTSTNSMTLTTPPDSEGEEERQQIAQGNEEEDSLSSTESDLSISSEEPGKRYQTNRRYRSSRRDDRASSISSGSQSDRRQGKRHDQGNAHRYDTQREQERPWAGENTGRDTKDLDHDEARKEAIRRWPWLFGDQYNVEDAKPPQDSQPGGRQPKRLPYIEALKRLALQRSSHGMSGDVERSLVSIQLYCARE